jgi:hypothetical protein
MGIHGRSFRRFSRTTNVWTAAGTVLTKVYPCERPIPLDCSKGGIGSAVGEAATLTSPSHAPLFVSVCRGLPAQAGYGSDERGRADTPTGGNAGRHCTIGLSKVCRIFKVAYRVLVSFLWSLNVSWPWDSIISARKSHSCACKSVGSARKSCCCNGREPTTSAEALLQRTLDKTDGLCAERDRLKAELPKPKGKVLGGRTW